MMKNIWKKKNLITIQRKLTDDELPGLIRFCLKISKLNIAETNHKAAPFPKEFNKSNAINWIKNEIRALESHE